MTYTTAVCTVKKNTYYFCLMTETLDHVYVLVYIY